MNIPRFTAQASLYKTNNRYRSSRSAFDDSRTTQTVIQMNMPDSQGAASLFTGEASLYAVSSGYTREGHHRTEQQIHPAAYDQTCLTGCKQDCGSTCAGTT